MKSFGLALSLSVALWAAGVSAQSSHSMTDSNTGITFQAFTDPQTNLTFGLVVPETIGSDFIGQIVVPTNGSGWGGVSLTGDMTDSLLIVAWPNGDEVMHSFRETSQYESPYVYNSSSVSLSEIPAGTFINSTHLSLTFLCSGCITNNSLSFTSNASVAVMGYAVSVKEVYDPSDSATELTYHAKGFGEFGMIIANASSSKYDTWAAMATGGSGVSSSGAASGAVSATSAAVTSTAVGTTSVAGFSSVASSFGSRPLSAVSSFGSASSAVSSFVTASSASASATSSSSGAKCHKANRRHF